MNLEDFPMDMQRCPLQLGSCKFSNENLSFSLYKDFQFRSIIFGELKLARTFTFTYLTIVDQLALFVFERYYGYIYRLLPYSQKPCTDINT